jgi:hypothetical protein
LPVGNQFEHLGAEPFTEFHHPLLMARRAKAAAFALIGQQIFVTTILALHSCKIKLAVSKNMLEHAKNL